MEHILELPDEVLLHVMRHLDVSDLLTCRVVSKRLGGLALDPHVWRHRSVKGGSDPWFCPALRLAPCARHLSLTIRKESSAERLALYTTTRCAAAALTVYVCCKKKAATSQAALMIRNQEALGRLRSLEVSCQDGTDPSVLVWTMALTSGLEKLKVPMYMELCTCALPAKSVSESSLREFFGFISPQSEDFLNFLLAGHAATLEEVTLVIGARGFYPARAASLLAAMPNLYKLSCPDLPGLEAVAACESLTEVTIVVGLEKSARPSSLEFLRRATQLRDVTVEYCWGGSRIVGADLVAALASSGSSCVETLKVFNILDDGQVYAKLPELLSALPKFPALEYLKLDTAPDELLEMIIAGSLPALQTLKMKPAWQQQGPKCAHGYLHWDLVQSALSANPSLELSLFMPPYCGKKYPCQSCVLGCHKWAMALSRCGFSDDEDDDDYDSGDSVHSDWTAEEHFFRAADWVEICELSEANKAEDP